MKDNFKNRVIKLFVFGTLREGGKLDYYMDGSLCAGKFYTEGQLMKSEIGSAYIDFDYKRVATIGEIYYLNYPGLQRIDHLESTSGEFPKGYDLDLIPVWELKEPDKYLFKEKEKSYALFYRRRNDPVKILSGDWINRKRPVGEIGKILSENTDENFDPEKLIAFMTEYLNN